MPQKNPSAATTLDYEQFIEHVRNDIKGCAFGGDSILATRFLVVTS